LVPTLPTPFTSNGTYVITGGTNGVGLALAQWAVENGARNLALIGSGKQTRPLTLLTLDSLYKAYPGLTVRIYGIDITNPTSVSTVLTSQSPPVKGIFHLATSYLSGKSDSVNESHFNEGFNVKAKGAMVLDKVCRDLRLSLDIFLMASSISAVYGNHYQAVYAAANSMLESIALDRRALGLPALIVDLPVMLGAGRLSDFEFVHELDINAGKGLQPVAVRHVFELFARLLGDPTAYPTHVTIDRPRWRAILSISRYARLVEHNLSPADRTRYLPSTVLKQQMAQPEVKPEASKIPETAMVKTVSRADINSDLSAKLAFLLGCNPQQLDKNAPLTTLGIDSLAAVELANWCSSHFGVTIGQAVVLSGISAMTLVDTIAASSLPPSAVISAVTSSETSASSYPGSEPLVRKAEVEI
jgi:nucleoside-diphosphate-sugar epimerase